MSISVGGVIYTIEPFVEATVPVTGRVHPAHGGRLLWHRFSEQPSGRIVWGQESTVGTGWGGLKQVFDGRGGIVYYVEPIVEATIHLNRSGNTPALGGRLMWARHLGHEDGSFQWGGPRVVGTGWAGFKQVFSAGEGVIYAVQENVEGVRLDRPGRTILSGGKLVWYRHLGHDDGTFRWEGPHEIASGWGDFTHVFAGGDHAIYAVRRNGDLVWYRHPGQLTGAPGLSAPRTVGTGWGIYEHLFYGGNGLVYGVEALQPSAVVTLDHHGTGISGGRLIRWHHKGMADGRFDWEGPTTLAPLWSGWERVFADGADRAVGVNVTGHRFCTFKDPAGSPTLGPRSYGISGETNVPRSMPLTWSIDANVSVSNIPAGGPPSTATFTPLPPSMWSIISQAFAVWSTPNPTSPSTALALTFEYVGSSGGDIAFGVQNFGGPDASGNITLGQTSDRGKRINFSTNSNVAFVPQTPAGGLLPGTVSLLSIAIHEIGHALGLLHNTNSASMMTPLLPAVQPEQLGADDIQSIRALYGWDAQRPVQGIGTDSSPVACACGPWLVMAWKGIDPDDSIWTCRSTDGLTWTPQRIVPGTGTADGPALAWDGNTLWLALRGIDDDDAVYWATSGDLGDNWSGLSQVPSAGSANGPAMTIFNGAPLLVWRGIPDDDGLYFNFWNNGWTTTGRIGGMGSTDRPAVCVDFNGVPRIVWRGIDGDDALYTTVFTGTISVPVWQPQQILQWIVLGNGGEGTAEIGVPGSLRGPSVTTIVRPTDQEVLLLWRGVDGDQGIYFTQGAPGVAGAAPVDWSTQAQIPGVGTAARPSIAVFKGRIFIVWRGVEGDHTIYTAFN